MTAALVSRLSWRMVVRIGLSLHSSALRTVWLIARLRLLIESGPVLIPEFATRRRRIHRYESVMGRWAVGGGGGGGGKGFYLAILKLIRRRVRIQRWIGWTGSCWMWRKWWMRIYRMCFRWGFRGADDGAEDWRDGGGGEGSPARTENSNQKLVRKRRGNWWDWLRFRFQLLRFGLAWPCVWCLRCWMIAETIHCWPKRSEAKSWPRTDPVCRKQSRPPWFPWFRMDGSIATPLVLVSTASLGQWCWICCFYSRRNSYIHWWWVSGLLPVYFRSTSGGWLSNATEMSSSSLPFRQVGKCGWPE